MHGRDARATIRKRTGGDACPTVLQPRYHHRALEGLAIPLGGFRAEFAEGDADGFAAARDAHAAGRGGVDAFCGPGLGCAADAIGDEDRERVACGGLLTHRGFDVPLVRER